MVFTSRGLVRPGAGKLQPDAWFVYQVLLEHSHIHSLAYGLCFHVQESGLAVTETHRAGHSYSLLLHGKLAPQDRWRCGSVGQYHTAVNKWTASIQTWNEF